MATTKAKIKVEDTTATVIAEKALKLEMSTRDDVQVPTKAFPLVVADNEHLLRATRGMMSETDYLTFNFAQSGSRLSVLTADCDVELKEGNNLKLDEGTVECEELIYNSKPYSGLYTVDGTDIEAAWRIVGGVATVILHICSGAQLPKNTECVWIGGDKLPLPLIPGTDKTACICSTLILGKSNLYFTVNGQGQLKTGRKPIPAGMTAIFNYLVAD